ncbi:hypothetical protein BHE90_014962 [Fusarium euwallaceae]|uniref:Uncharacterized protein n=1 Tax=Fusarium euwallaceae TaxID=1147111 RepID=A0A430L4L2_9HYPO|nr:hypothetical protein BHE90_014962 [Fusarium euwallaceae]
MSTTRNQRPRQMLIHVADDVLPIREEERPICEDWLRSIGFFAPGEDEELWHTIVRNWERFLKATKTKITGSGASRRVTQSAAAKQREAVKQAFWDRIDGLEALSERWSVKSRLMLNQSAEGPDARQSKSLAAIWLLEKWRRFQSMWTSFICFLTWSIKVDEESLEEMRLNLDDEKKEDLLDLGVMCWFMNDDDPGDIIQGVLIRMITDESVNVRMNPLLWWTAILVRSAISDEEEGFISRGRFSLNILPLDVDIRDRIGAIGHYSKVLILDKAFQWWQKGRVGRQVWLEEVLRDLNAADNEWLNDENGQRPDDQLDRRTCLPPWRKMMLEHLGKEGQDCLGQNEGTAMWKVRTLLCLLRRVRE